jgi:outer membrane protein assembly factor BamB
LKVNFNRSVTEYFVGIRKFEGNISICVYCYFVFVNVLSICAKDDGSTIFCRLANVSRRRISHWRRPEGSLVLTPTLLWKYTIRNTVVSSPAVVSGVVYIGSYDDSVYALKASDGDKLWNSSTGGEIDSSPAVANGIVLIGSDEGNIYGLNATNGNHLWNRSTGAYIWSSPAVSNGIVYAGSDNDNVYALGALPASTPSSSSSTYLSIVIGTIVVVVIVAAVVFFMSKKRLKTNKTHLLSFLHLTSSFLSFHSKHSKKLCLS